MLIMEKLLYSQILSVLKKDFSRVLDAYNISLDEYLANMDAWTEEYLMTCENDIFHFLTTNIDLGFELGEQMVEYMDNVLVNHEKDPQYIICNKTINKLKKGILHKLIILKNRANWLVDDSQLSVKSRVSWTMNPL